MKKPVIKTKQVTLRLVKMSDAKNMAKYANNPKIARNITTLPHPYRLSDANKFLKKVTKEMKKSLPASFTFAIEKDGEVIGSFGIESIIRGHMADIGYWLAEPYWGQGILSEIVKKVTDYAFKEFKLKRIEAKVYTDNPASKRVLEKNGFQVEGVLKKNIKKGDKFIDAFLLAKVK